MKYLYIDGDDIGLKIECSFFENDELQLQTINNDVKYIINEIQRHVVSKSFKIIFSGADGVIAKGKSIEASTLLSFVRSINSQFTFSIGIGNSLKDSYTALRYAKSKNKNIAVEYFDNEFEIVS
jgi:hypothetical protein